MSESLTLQELHKKRFSEGRFYEGLSDCCFSINMLAFSVLEKACSSAGLMRIHIAPKV